MTNSVAGLLRDRVALARWYGGSGEIQQRSTDNQDALVAPFQSSPVHAHRSKEHFRGIPALGSSCRYR